MTTSKNPNVDGPQATPCDAGALKFNRHVFDFAGHYAPAAIAADAAAHMGAAVDDGITRLLSLRRQGLIRLSLPVQITEAPERAP